MKNWRQTLKDILRAGTPEKYRHTIAVHGASREKAIKYIEDVGGYIGHNERYPLSWSAKVYNVDLDAQALYEHEVAKEFPSLQRLCSNDGERGVLYALFCEKYAEHEQYLFEVATENAWNNFSDGGNQFFWDPAYTVEFGLTGRSGGNLVLVDMDGRLNCTNEAWAETFREKDPNDYNRYVVGHRFVAEAFLIAVCISLDWPQKAIAREVQYHAAWFVWQGVNQEEFAALLEKYAHCKDPLDYLREQP